MRILVLGAGPTGLTLGATLARRGHEVVAVDRDPGPAPDGTWQRRGVMQFGHAHGFRPQVRDLLVAEWPEAYDAWLGLGAEPVVLGPPGADGPLAMRSRRIVYERALRAAAPRVDGLTVRAGHVDGLVERDGQVTGAAVDGVADAADLVVAATGRASRITAASGGDDLGGDCGIAYVNRTYRLRTGAERGPLTTPTAWAGVFDGYMALVFVHERGHFSVVLVRPTADAPLRDLRHRAAFDAACRAIPGLADWTDPRRATPTSEVSVGGHLLNVYRRPRPVPGLVAVGDAVSTTAPTAGRGVAMASMQCAALLRLLDGGADPRTVAEPFGDWCDAEIRPWVEDHLAMDGEQAAKWQGADIDLSRPLTSAAIVAAAPADPRIREHIGGYMAMTALPTTLAPAEPLARAVYASGWRAPLSAGPGRDELVALLRAEVDAAAA